MVHPYSRIALSFLVALMIGSFGIPHSVSAYVVGLQFKDDGGGAANSTGGNLTGCSAGLGAAGYASLNGSSGWIGDSDFADPNCARIWAGTDTIPVGTDFRICLQATDLCSSGGSCTNTGSSGSMQCSGWASSSAWSPIITDGDSWDPDAWKLTVQTQSLPAPTNRQITDYSFALKVGDAAGGNGSGACNQWTAGSGVLSGNKASGGGWSSWANDGNSPSPDGLGPYTNFNCLQVIAYNAITTISPSSGTLTASPTSLPSTGGSVTLTWSSTNTTGGGVTLWNITDNVMYGTTGGSPSINTSGSKTVSVTGAPKTFRLDTWNSANQAGSSASVVVSAAASCTVNGTSYPSGTTKTFYSASSSSNCAGISQSRTCTNGTMSGSSSYMYASCTNAASCTVNGTTYNSGTTNTFYSAQISSNCASIVQSRTCTNGVMSGSSSYMYSTCTAPPTVTLSTNKNSGSYSSVSSMSITTGDTVGLQWTSTNATSCSGTASPSDSSFAPSGTSGTDTTLTEPTSGNSRTYTVTCTGPGGSASDSVIITNAAAACTVNGNSYASGSTNTFYNTTSVPYGDDCDTTAGYAQSRTCTNGVMSGTASYQYASCSTQAPASCTLDGVTVPHSGSYTFYNTETVPFGENCSDSAYALSRTCNNGTLSGSSSFMYGSCSVDSNAQTDITLTATNSQVRAGNSTTLTWDGGNSTSCSLTGTNGFSSTAIMGTNVSTGAITQKTIFTLNCSRSSSSKQATVTVGITPQVQEI